jgi:hypothetical protein
MNRPTAYYRARTGSDDPLFSGGGSQASQAEEEPQEAENRMKAAGDLRDLRLLGVLAPLPPKIGGGEGGRARVGYSDPKIRGGVRR